MTPTRILSPASKCRVCGCTDLNACIVDVRTGDVLSPETLERRIAQRGYAHAINFDTVACYWVEPDLCSACVGLGRPTDAEAPPFYGDVRDRQWREARAAAAGLVVMAVVLGLIAWIGGGR
jgi:hypothetical protein